VRWAIFAVFTCACGAARAPEAIPSAPAHASIPPWRGPNILEIVDETVVLPRTKVSNVYLAPDGTVNVAGGVIATLHADGRIFDRHGEERAHVDHYGHLELIGLDGSMDADDSGVLRIRMPSRTSELDMKAYLVNYPPKLWRTVMIAFLLDVVFFEAEQ
jgi:hypothetical protein